MNTQEEIYPKTNCLALTVRKEHRLMVIHKITRKTFSISWKTILYAFLLTFANIMI